MKVIRIVVAIALFGIPDLSLAKENVGIHIQGAEEAL